MFQAAALTLLLAMAVPGIAADERAVKSRVQPVYPEIARRLKITGSVAIHATVDADGKVTDVKTLSGNRMLGPAAEDAVRKWRFAPGSGETTVDVSVNFASSL
jgi:TonB family protein